MFLVFLFTSIVFHFENQRTADAHWDYYPLSQMLLHQHQQRPLPLQASAAPLFPHVKDWSIATAVSLRTSDMHRPTIFFDAPETQNVELDKLLEILVLAIYVQFHRLLWTENWGDLWFLNLRRELEKLKRKLETVFKYTAINLINMFLLAFAPLH